MLTFWRSPPDSSNMASFQKRLYTLDTHNTLYVQLPTWPQMRDNQYSSQENETSRTLPKMELWKPTHRCQYRGLPILTYLDVLKKDAEVEKYQQSVQKWREAGWLGVMLEYSSLWGQTIAREIERKRQREREDPELSINTVQNRYKKNFQLQNYQNYPEGRRTETTLHKKGSKRGRKQATIHQSGIRPQGKKIRRRTGDIYKAGADPPIKSSHRCHNWQHPAFSHPTADALWRGMRHRHHHSEGHAHGFIWHPIEQMGCWTHTQRNGTLFQWVGKNLWRFRTRLRQFEKNQKWNKILVLNQIHAMKGCEEIVN